ncbi:hypothetical protein DDB_G0270350 [Dictyostelium discoideum AX4]|uniref:Uncharacterized protein n=1 Tax=Dictyostelium discoideum TaxID=44689 RepID=Q55BV3_DICDI|nr:hypothetical protein DDB_G0270350 [Dictyostelium discoideum AX4]EAL72525.1 hypothetical protein DDB_G0270350 [Dictyostelium discoideum AX4]|eukprot:XP_646728.1 hypothetical protein DDB_G0270350 [Dictyostelium discoideum AX4]
MSEDTQLIRALQRVLPAKILKEIEGDLTQFGERVVKDILELGRASENNPPKLIQYDAWGKRIDKIVVDESWNKLKDIGCSEGLVSIGYERKYQEYSRIYQYIKIYLFACSSAVFDCPMSMTDGAARLIELYGDKGMKEDEYKHEGQWMTEKTGGSDVSKSETIAVSSGSGDVMNGDMEYAESNSRRFAYLMAQTYMASLLLEHAVWSKDELDAQVAERWCFVKLENGKTNKNSTISFTDVDEKWRELDIKLALDLNEHGQPKLGTYDINSTKLRSKY